MDCPSGYDLVKYEEVFSSRYPEAQIEETLVGPEAEAYIKRLNQLPPTTTYEGKQVTVFISPDRKSIMAVIIEPPCVVVDVPMQPSVHQMLRRAASRESS